MQETVSLIGKNVRYQPLYSHHINLMRVVEHDLETSFVKLCYVDSNNNPAYLDGQIIYLSGYAKHIIEILD